MPAAMMSGQAHPKILDRFNTLTEAMRGAIDHAEDIGPDAAPQLLAILDHDERLVLAGAASDGAVAWCNPVANAVEARAVVIEACQSRTQAARADRPRLSAPRPAIDGLALGRRPRGGPGTTPRHARGP